MKLRNLIFGVLVAVLALSACKKNDPIVAKSISLAQFVEWAEPGVVYSLSGTVTSDVDASCQFSFNDGTVAEDVRVSEVLNAAAWMGKISKGDAVQLMGSYLSFGGLVFVANTIIEKVGDNDGGSGNGGNGGGSDTGTKVATYDFLASSWNSVSDPSYGAGYAMSFGKGALNIGVYQHAATSEIKVPGVDTPESIRVYFGAAFVIKSSVPFTNVKFTLLEGYDKAKDNSLELITNVGSVSVNAAANSGEWSGSAVTELALKAVSQTRITAVTITFTGAAPEGGNAGGGDNGGGDNGGGDDPSGDLSYEDIVYLDAYRYAEGGDYYWDMDAFVDYDYDAEDYIYPEVYFSYKVKNMTGISGDYALVNWEDKDGNPYCGISTSATSLTAYTGGTAHVECWSEETEEYYATYYVELDMQLEGGKSEKCELILGLEMAMDYDEMEYITLTDSVVQTKAPFADARYSVRPIQARKAGKAMLRPVMNRKNHSK